MMGTLRLDDKDAKEKIGRIKMLIFDVDGVLTNGDLIYGPDGTEYKHFSVQDGLGFTLARKAGLKTGIITARKSEVVERRAKELKLDAFHQGGTNKAPAFGDILEEFDLLADEVCYMGDDLLDLVLIRRAGFSASPANGRPEVQEKVDYVTDATGGAGAARELIELILTFQEKWNDVLEDF